MFNEVIVAIFETDEDADHAVADMLAAHVPESSIQRHTKTNLPAATASFAPADTNDHEAGHGPGHGPGHGFWSRLFGGHSDDHAVYDKALHNGANVITVTAVPGHDMGAVMAILEKHNPVDLDEQAVSFTGIAHDPDPVVRGSDEPLAPPLASELLVNQGGPRVRRFAVPPKADTTP